MTVGAHQLPARPGTRLRGVNLGGWLVLERWITPSLFADVVGSDETAFCTHLGSSAERRIRRHRETFVTADDFRWLAERGVNALRIPVGHWIFGDPVPYHPAYGDHANPYVGAIDILDWAMTAAGEAGLSVMIDLHSAPGCQNGFDHGGIAGCIDWPTRREYVEHSLRVIERLAERYAGQPALGAIEVLNEPNWTIATPLLREYAERAYRRVRKHCSADAVSVVFQEGFRPLHEWTGFLTEPDFSSVACDIHRYQCFLPEDRATDIYGHVRKAAIDWKNEADELNRKFLWTIVGEWSLGLDPQWQEEWLGSPANHIRHPLDSFQRDQALRAYASAQLIAFERHLGWFFWTYRTESSPEWSFRDAVERGWLPGRFA